MTEDFELSDDENNSEAEDITEECSHQTNEQQVYFCM
jgi:hypothetical protein